MALMHPKTVPVTFLAAGLVVALMSFSIWKNARAIFGDDAYSRAKSGDARITLE